MIEGEFWQLLALRLHLAMPILVSPRANAITRTSANAADPPNHVSENVLCRTMDAVDISVVVMCTPKHKFS